MDGAQIIEDEEQRRILQEYIFGLEEAKEKAEELAVAHDRLKNAEAALKAAYEKLEERNNDLARTNAQLNQYRTHLEELVNKRTRQLEQEILERELQDKALRELEELESSILGAISHAVIGVWGRTVVFANSATEKVFGWKPEELVGQNTRLLYETHHEYERIGELYSFQENQRVQRTETRCRHKDGRDMICRLTVAKIGNSQEDKRAVATFEDITEQKRVEGALKESEERYRSLFHESRDPIYIISSHGRLIDANDPFFELFGYTREMVGEANARDVYADIKEKERLKEALKANHFVKNFELRLRKTNGTLMDCMVTVTERRDEEGHTAVYQGIMRDVTEQKKVETELKASLTEKETLLQEVHHRVKNNLQVISSLLDLQMKYTKENQWQMAFQESKNRIHSMALIHEKLYASENLSRISFADYVKDLTTHLHGSYGVSAKEVVIKTNIAQVSVGVDTAVSLGLIINELLSNSLKHAFPSSRKGVISVDFFENQENKYSLVVSDNGVGLSEELDFRNTGTLGLRLIKLLTGQLKGAMELDTRGGTKFKIVFDKPMNGKKERIHG